MKNRSQHPIGPAKLKANFTVINLKPDGMPSVKLHKGFVGYKGWKYHPTRGFKRVSGFNPFWEQQTLTIPIDSEAE